MKKLDDLLKKVEFFEKLAMYGNRGTFLKSLANSDFTPELDALLSQARGLLTKAGLGESPTAYLLGNIMLKKQPTDLNKVIDELDKAKNTLPPSLTNGVVMTQLGRVIANLSEYSKSHNSVNFEDLPPAEAPGAMAPQTPKLPSKSDDASWSGLSIGPEIQKALNKLMFLAGTPNALEEDGKFGPKTKSVLDAFKKRYHIEKWDDSKASQFAWLTAKDERHF
jgi:hypothetical protein